MTTTSGHDDGNAPDGPTGEGQDRFGRLAERARTVLARPQGQVKDRSRGSDKFAKFTERARRTLALAQEEARRLNHNYIGTEHVLLGLLREGDGIAARALGSLNVELDQVRATVERIVGRGDQAVAGEVGLTPRAKKAIELGFDEAKRLRHRFLGTEHLLLGLIREGNGVAVGALTSLGVSLDRLRAQVIELIPSSGHGEEPGEPRTKGNVVMCRVDDRDLEAIDTLIEAGIRTTRSDAAAWLIHAGIEANAPLFQTIDETVAEIRRLRGVAQGLAQQAAGGDSTPPTQPLADDATPAGTTRAAS